FREGAALAATLTWQLRLIFLGAILSLPSVLPTAEWFSMSRRAMGLQSLEIYMYSANWYDLLSAVLGPALGDLRIDPRFRSLVIPERIPPYVACAFIGSVSTTLAVWGAFAKKWWPKYLWIALLVLSVVASLGINTPIMPALVSNFPALGFVRFPVKL